MNKVSQNSCPLGISDCDLILEKAFCRCYKGKELEMRSWLRVDSKSHGSVIKRHRKRETRDTGRGHVRTEAEMSDDATSQGTTRSWKTQRRILLYRFQWPRVLISNFWPPEL